jgi:hypothetical protein
MINTLSKKTIRSDYILVVLLLVFSGDPIIRFLGKSAPLILSVLVLIIKYKHLGKDFFTKFFCIASALLLLFFLQNMVLNFVSWLSAFRYISTILLGGLVFYLVAERFSYRFFIVLFYVSIISLVFFVVFNLLNIRPPGLEWREARVTYIFYTFVEQHHYRNCGMFWEPGAFAGVLTLCMALNAKYLPVLWKNHRFKVIVIVLALLSTKSTTGYLVFFGITVYYLLFFIKSTIVKFTVIPILLILVVVVYENADFLQEKINQQTEKSENLAKGDFSNTRFGSLILDLPYIKKHPLVGNGFNEKTRYADDPQLIQQIESGDDIANGNGFSNFLACLGIPFMFFYLLISFKVMNKFDTRVALLVIIVMLMSLWGEQWLFYPLYTGMLFINIKNFV